MQIIRLSILLILASIFGVVTSFANPTSEELALHDALDQFENENPPSKSQKTMHYIKVSVEILEFIMLLSGALILLKKRKELGAKLMASAMGITALMIPMTVLFETQINRWNLTYVPFAAWGTTTLLFSSGFLMFALKKTEAYQSTSDNADKPRV